MGGLLAENCIIDKGAVYAALDSEESIDIPNHIRLSALAEAESWARVWTSRKRNSERTLINGTSATT